ncbi:MAG: hypothetical protein JOY76_12005 [Hyphomicrobiales bacterium]|nr:hypothetical protein [Hyphomicrobiales bacterium]
MASETAAGRDHPQSRAEPFAEPGSMKLHYSTAGRTHHGPIFRRPQLATGHAA